jgi:hypothetical protein
MGFQSAILAPVSEAAAFEKMIRRRDCGTHKKPLAGSLRLIGMAIMASRPPSPK